MADDTNTSFPAERQDGRRPGMRQGGSKEPGGFRIRLSDNEMQAARALQEAFGLRSTVAVLGFALRTMAQQLEQGQLAELVNQHRSQAGGPPDSRSHRAEPRGNRSEAREASSQRPPKVDPFARPSKPVPPPAAVEPEPEPEQPTAEASDAPPIEAAAEVSSDPVSAPAAEISDSAT